MSEMSDTFIFGGAAVVVLIFLSIMLYRPSRHGANVSPQPLSQAEIYKPQSAPARTEFIEERFASKLPAVGSMRGVPLPPPWGAGPGETGR